MDVHDKIFVVLFFALVLTIVVAYGVSLAFVEAPEAPACKCGEHPPITIVVTNTIIREVTQPIYQWPQPTPDYYYSPSTPQYQLIVTNGTLELKENYTTKILEPK